jgi:predicted nuclease of predicted toxin-antitoxin system
VIDAWTHMRLLVDATLLGLVGDVLDTSLLPEAARRLTGPREGPLG